MHETTRRFLCRFLFVTLCILPTLAVSGWAYVRSSPGYAKSIRVGWETAIAQRIGLRVELEKVGQPRRNATLLSGVKLLDPETSEVVATIRVVELVQSERGVAVLASQPEIHGRHLPRLAELLHDRLLRGPSLVGQSVQFVAAELTLKDDKTPRTFTNVDALVEPSSDGPRAAIAFRLAGVEMPGPASFHIWRLHAPEPATQWKLHTPAAPLPCALFAPFLDRLGRLGPDASFHGTVWGTHRTAGWEGEVTGRFDNVDLDRVVSESFPHKLSGHAAVLMRVGTFRHNRIERLDGTLLACDGVASDSLLRSVAQELNVSYLGGVIGASNNNWRYSQLAIGFHLDQRGLEFHGLCETPEPGVILTTGTTPLLRKSQSQVIPAVNLIRALAPGNELQVPASKETESLIQTLPLPEIRPLRSAPPTPRVSLTTP